ncbi:hypothetical protein FRC06_000624 [Ceratobasidium sp. 370]|nr:hypothetical protein FRC06_000624 [Ceratobasidium sp. 370]
MPGDDLDDGLVLEPAFVDDAESDNASILDAKDERESFSQLPMHNDINMFAPAQEPTPVAGKKRKRAQKPPAECKVKKPKQQHDTPARLVSMCQSPEALVQLLGRALIKAFPKMSDLEREELAIPGPSSPPPTPPSDPHANCRLSYGATSFSSSCPYPIERASHPQSSRLFPESALVDTTKFTTERTHATLPDFISATSRIAQRPKHHAAPTAIVVAGAALRVADLTRTVRPLKGESGGEIAKVRFNQSASTRTVARLKLVVSRVSRNPLG